MTETKRPDNACAECGSVGVDLFFDRESYTYLCNCCHSGYANPYVNKWFGSTVYEKNKCKWTQCFERFFSYWIPGCTEKWTYRFSLEKLRSWKRCPHCGKGIEVKQ